MTKEDDKRYIESYKQDVEKQYALARQEKSQNELNKADKMYNTLMNLNEKYYKMYGERLNIFLQ